MAMMGNPDKLGVQVKSRAKERYRDERPMHGYGAGGPLPDWNWKGYFQSLNEAGVDNLADASVGYSGENKQLRGMRPSIYSLLNQQTGRSF